MKSNRNSFESEFLEKYLKYGLGSLPKSDIDALVMYLLDKHGFQDSKSLSKLSNQEVSEKLRTPVARIKKLRYEAALKFGGAVEDEARGRLLAALACATIEPEQDKIRLIIEDSLAKNWLQGQLKINQQIFDHSFNTEIISVSSDGLFDVLEVLFDREEVRSFREAVARITKISEKKRRNQQFKQVAIKFAEVVATAGGGAVLEALRSRLPFLP